LLTLNGYRHLGLTPSSATQAQLELLTASGVGGAENENE
jgi:hypothetical protein